MNKDLIKITQDKERAKSLFDTALIRLDAIDVLSKADKKKFLSKIVEEHYESILEFITAVICLDGFKVREDASGSHLAVIDYLRDNYKQFKEHEITMIDSLRRQRIGIKYYGKRVKEDYLDSNIKDILIIREKLIKIVKKKLA